jgi:hypothetical protein
MKASGGTEPGHPASARGCDLDATIRSAFSDFAGTHLDMSSRGSLPAAGRHAAEAMLMAQATGAVSNAA